MEDVEQKHLLINRKKIKGIFGYLLSFYVFRYYFKINVFVDIWILQIKFSIDFELVIYCR
jgi:hypothetical protein